LAFMRFSGGYAVWRIGGLVFVIISLVFMGYATDRYEPRRLAIAARSRGPYSDRFGPMILVLLLIAAVIVNIVLAYEMYFVNACTGTPMLDTNFVQYSPTGISYHKGKEKVLMIQTDTFTLLDPNSFETVNYMAPGNHTGIVVTPRSDDLVYIANMYPCSIDEYSISTGEMSRRFPIWIPNSNSLAGISGLAFVPDSSNPNGGQFWVASGVDGNVYTYDLPLVNKNETAGNFTGNFAPMPGMTNLKALFYHAESHLVYGINGQWLFSMLPSMNAKGSGLTLLGFPDPTGVAVVGQDSDIRGFVSCGQCSDVWHFNFSPYNGITSGKCYPPTAGSTGINYKIAP